MFLDVMGNFWMFFGRFGNVLNILARFLDILGCFGMFFV